MRREACGWLPHHASVQLVTIRGHEMRSHRSLAPRSLRSSRTYNVRTTGDRRQNDGSDNDLYGHDPQASGCAVGLAALADAWMASAAWKTPAPSAIVMYSLFEEQIEGESHLLDHYLTYGAESFAEALDYFPEMDSYNVGPDSYLDLISRPRQRSISPSSAASTASRPAAGSNMPRAFRKPAPMRWN